MGSIGRYIFRTTMGAFLLILFSVTLLMWITQALRSIDVMTDQGQTFLVFLGITALIIPMLIMIIAPIALLIAIAHVLTKLGNDSELIVMNASGMSPWRVFRPFLAVGLIVSLGVAAIAFYISPKCLREVRRWAAELHAELVSSKVQAGRFTTVEGNLTLHIRERLPNGQLSGVLLDDQRDQKERITILAERGDLLDNERGTFLVLGNGAVHRHEAGQRDPIIVGFTQYAFDLSRLSPPSSVEFSVQERSIEELIWPRPDDATYKRLPEQFRAELYNRLAMPLYPLAFMVVIFVYLGPPRTTRQSRTLSLASAIMAAMAVRTLGFVGAVSGARSTAALLSPFFALAAVFLLGGWAIWRGFIIEPPAYITNALNSLTEGLTRRKFAIAGQAS
jgi:lipopolysaccharide export system permease protein